MTPLTKPKAKALNLQHPDRFADRHIGPDEAEAAAMLQVLGYKSLDALVDAVVPASIRLAKPLALPPAEGEAAALAELKALAAQNQLWRSYIGMGYSDTVTPPVILRNILENPGWYTAYTPYQAEISQGRLEALLNFQTMAADLTGLELANASMLDEATAAAEAMAMAHALKAAGKGDVFLADAACHPQTLEVLKTRAAAFGWQVRVAEAEGFAFGPEVFGLLVQYPATDGLLRDDEALFAKAKEAGVLCAAACDLLALTLLRAPGDIGADIAVGNSQRFGVPLGYGGPHAGFLATRKAFVRQMPGRLVGLSKDSRGKAALRLAIQTREQHIKREKATSNICTAQVLLAVIASMYAVYHGPEGLKAIAARVRDLTGLLALGLRKSGFKLRHDAFFDTLRVEPGTAGFKGLLARCKAAQVNVRHYQDGSIGISLDEKSSEADVLLLIEVVSGSKAPALSELAAELESALPPALERKTPFLTHPVFNTHRSETSMLRYLRGLEAKDLSLTTSMIPLGSCTMKLNATAEMLPVTWPEFGGLHPFAPVEQAGGYRMLFGLLETWLAELTGFAAVSLQPNAGSQGEYAGLLVIDAYHKGRGDSKRKVCLIPQSAHGTNPASAAMAGMKIVIVACDESGNIDLKDLEAKAEAHKDELSCLMATYPSTHGVFEEGIRKVCELVHARGGQVYLDGANMNAQVGLCRPGDYGADVGHLNLHKTFCIPHGGGGPGMGPIGVARHLAPYLPGHPVIETGGEKAVGPVSAAPWGSAGILPISWMYIRMMGGAGLTQATKAAILNANYVAKKLSPHYPVLYKGRGGLVAHECILDLRALKNSSGVQVEDVAKRLMDYGFHAPTVSFPVSGTLMVEPTESENLAELDRFCEAMIAIRKEIADIEAGRMSREDNPLKNAPHTADQIAAADWTHPYSRETAAFPAPWTRERKYWPPVSRIDAPYGDRNLVCSCPPVEAWG